jgi:hypothetical protein
MRRRLIMCAIALGLSTLGWIGARPGDASTVQTCTYNENWTFSPPLTTSKGTGTATLNGTFECLATDSTGASGFTSGPAGPGTFTYSGSCLSASLVGPDNQTGTIIGGSAIILHAVGGLTGDSSVTAIVAVPQTVCNESGTLLAVGAGEGFIP